MGYYSPSPAFLLLATPPDYSQGRDHHAECLRDAAREEIERMEEINRRYSSGYRPIFCPKTGACLV